METKKQKMNTKKFLECIFTNKMITTDRNLQKPCLLELNEKMSPFIKWRHFSFFPTN